MLSALNRRTNRDYSGNTCSAKICGNCGVRVRQKAHRQIERANLRWSVLLHEKLSEFSSIEVVHPINVLWLGKLRLREPAPQLDEGVGISFSDACESRQSEDQVSESSAA